MRHRCNIDETSMVSVRTLMIIFSMFHIDACREIFWQNMESSESMHLLSYLASQLNSLKYYAKKEERNSQLLLDNLMNRNTKSNHGRKYPENSLWRCCKYTLQK